MAEQLFRTTLKLKPQNSPINYQSSVTLIGSCFSENMHKKLAYYGFQTNTNPFGILFHPIAIEKTLKTCVYLKKYSKEDLFYFNELFHSFDLHSEFSNPSEEDLLYQINQIITETHSKLKTTTHLIITLGTAWIYEKEGEIVANCHKVPQKEFNKKLLSIKEISASLKRIKELIQSINPAIQIIYTVSPIRHLKDGFTENTLSKSYLIAAIHQVTNTKNNWYFPAYEIMMDDLRDYRFYEKDMLHPNEIAIDYIWHYFKNVWIDKHTESLQNEIEKIRKAKMHKAFQPNSTAHQQFIKEIEARSFQIESKFHIKL